MSQTDEDVTTLKQALKLINEAKFEVTGEELFEKAVVIDKLMQFKKRLLTPPKPPSIKKVKK